MTEVSSTPIDPWLNKLKEKDLNLYQEFIRGASSFSGMSKALFIYCKNDLESDNLIDIFKNNSDAEIIEEVLIHEKCPKDLIQDIINGKLNKSLFHRYGGAKNSSVMKEYVAKRNDININDIKILLKNANEDLKQVIAENINLDNKLIETLARESSEWVRRNLALRSDLSPKTINEFVNDTEWFVRDAIALNKSLNDDQIKKLIKDKETSVKCSLAMNKSLNNNFLRILSKGKSIEVLTKLSERTDISDDIYEEILKNPILVPRSMDTFKLILNMLSNDNISNTILNQICRYLINTKSLSWDFNDFDLENTQEILKEKLLRHSKLSDEQKAELILLSSSIDNLKSDNSVKPEETSFIFQEDYSKLSSQIFRFGLEPDQKQEVKTYVSKFTQIFTDLGQPIGLLHPLTNLHQETKYDLGQTFSEWVSHEIIHRTLWPEISKRNDAQFWINTDSYNGDLTHFTVTGIDTFETFYDRGEMRIHGLGYSFINDWGEYREWIIDSGEIEFDDVINEIDFENYLDFQGLDFEDDVIDDETYDYFLANAIKEMSDEVEITPLGKEFINETVLNSGAFEESSTTSAEIDLENCHVYGWSKLKLDKQEFITRLIIEGLQSNNEILQKFSDYFLVTIALIPDLNPKIKKILEELNNDSISKALNLSSK